jgi:hypothetical protein
MRDALNPNHALSVVLGALPVRGTVTVEQRASGGFALRVAGRTNRSLASRALRRAGYAPVLCDVGRGTLHIPAPRKAIT